MVVNDKHVAMNTFIPRLRQRHFSTSLLLNHFSGNTLFFLFLCRSSDYVSTWMILIAWCILYYDFGLWFKTNELNDEIEPVLRKKKFILTTVSYHQDHIFIFRFYSSTPFGCHEKLIHWKLIFEFFPQLVFRNTQTKHLFMMLPKRLLLFFAILLLSITFVFTD